MAGNTPASVCAAKFVVDSIWSLQPDQVVSGVALGDDTFRGIAYKIMSPGQDTNPTGGARLKTDVVIMVVSVRPGKVPDAQQIDEARLIDQALDMKFGSNDYGQVFSCARESEVNMALPLSKGGYRLQIGGIYRLLVRGT